MCYNYDMQNLNFAFFGTPEVAVETLEILKQGGYVPSLIVTSPDQPKGRKMTITPPPAKVWAEENGVPCLQPEKLGAEFAEKLAVPTLVGAASSFDLFIIVAYGKILPENIIQKPRLGSINIHYSLLPKYRGASPVEAAILNDDKETGVTIQQMEYKLDSGAILAQKKIQIGAEETAPELRRRLIKIGGDLLVKTLPAIVQKEIKPIPQDETEATFCKKMEKADGLINLAGNPKENYNKFRAYAEWPRVFFFENGRRIIITKASLENGKFLIKRIIPEGGKERDYRP